MNSITFYSGACLSSVVRNYRVAHSKLRAILVDPIRDTLRCLGWTHSPVLQSAR